VITQNLPAAPHGYRIAVNVDGVNTTAPLTLELLDQRGRPIANLAAAKVDQSGVRQSAWAQAVGAGQPVALRITLPAGADARLYAVYAAPEP
jgi:hypothetical protein